MKDLYTENCKTSMKDNEEHTQTHTHNGILFSHEKERNPVFCNNMDESGGHYTKWNKPDREYYNLHERSIKKSQIHRNRE